MVNLVILKILVNFGEFGWFGKFGQISIKSIFHVATKLSIEKFYLLLWEVLKLNEFEFWIDWGLQCKSGIGLVGIELELIQR